MARTFVALTSLLALASCASAGSTANTVATAGLAAIAGSATGSPLIGLIVGLAASYGVDEGVKYGERLIQENVQNAVADAAGSLEPGQSASWEVPEKLPLTGRSGTVEVAREFGEAIPCKDVVFTVGSEPDFYTTTICRTKQGVWRWATAEPTVRRWGDLQ